MEIVSFRLANIEDAQMIANFHVRVWRHTYKDLAPFDAFATLNEAYRGRKWRESLTSGDMTQMVLIAEAGGKTVGIGAAGRPSESLFKGRGEIKFLYIDPDFKRRGIGRSLLKRLASHLVKMGYEGIALSVVKGNDAAVSFYEALRAQIVGEYVDSGPIWRSQNIVYAWDDVACLLQ